MQTSRNLLVVLCAVLCAIGNAHADVLENIEKFEKCLRTASLELDDLISPASDIALAVAARCSPSWQAVLVANNEPLAKMDKYPSAEVKDAALRTVLTTRRELAELKSNSTKQEPRKPNRTM
ncbi:MAG TPA: hypothetical protein GXX56_09070 [Rhodocyclaceae bacterium]|nr:hypothetical protein [Rhodocyclaceae bacterium]